MSRSYAYPYALVAVHWAPVGVDIERVAACDERFAALICTPTERRATVVAGDRDRYLTSLWSSKEALAKVLGSPVRYEPHRLESPLAWPAEKPGLWQAQELEIDADHVAWVCWRRPFS